MNWEVLAEVTVVEPDYFDAFQGLLLVEQHPLLFFHPGNYALLIGRTCVFETGFNFCCSFEVLVIFGMMSYGYLDTCKRMRNDYGDDWLQAY